MRSLTIDDPTLRSAVDAYADSIISISSTEGQIAEEVLASGQEKALEPMSPADRKAVHDAINEMSGVQTRSEGEDPNRHIVIAPAG